MLYIKCLLTGVLRMQYNKFYIAFEILRIFLNCFVFTFTFYAIERGSLFDILFISM